MKTQLLLCLLLISHCVLAQPWNTSWLPQGEGLLPFGYVVNGISVVDDSVLWVTASLDEEWSYPISVYRSTDAGESWSAHPISHCITCKSSNIEAIDDQTAWITTYDELGFGKLYKTEDAGQSWVQKLEDPSAKGIVQIFDDMHLMCHDRGYFAWSEDGGENWETDVVTAAFPGYFPYLFGQASSSGETIWLGMAPFSNPSPSVSAQLVRATNYGRDIEFIDTGLDSVYSIWSVSMNDQNHGIMAYTEWIYEFDFYYGMGYYASSDELLAISGDGGESWTTIENPLPGLSRMISVPGRQQAYVVADGPRIAWTSNSGTEWSYHYTPYDISCIDFSGPDAGWIGVNGKSIDHPLVLKWNADFVSGIRENKQTHQIPLQIFPNPAQDLIRYHLEDAALGMHTLTLSDLNGQLVLENKTDVQELNISELPAGVYILEIAYAGNHAIAKIMKD